ncbi:hypothetical protein EDB85DRAFT_1438939 [Lactarius pseudohatsudake]|nr:hypothetical protein EDB85DRAFT_1438939 [Lactarius pseudohatsudake]
MAAFLNCCYHKRYHLRHSLALLRVLQYVTLVLSSHLPVTGTHSWFLDPPNWPSLTELATCASVFPRRLTLTLVHIMRLRPVFRTPNKQARLWYRSSYLKRWSITSRASPGPQWRRRLFDSQCRCTIPSQEWFKAPGCSLDIQYGCAFRVETGSSTLYNSGVIVNRSITLGACDLRQHELSVNNMNRPSSFAGPSSFPLLGILAFGRLIGRVHDHANSRLWC